MSHALYPLAYAVMITVALLIILFAQLQRRDQEGIKVNWGIIEVLTILDLVAWAGTALVVVIYSP